MLCTYTVEPVFCKIEQDNLEKTDLELYLLRFLNLFSFIWKCKVFPEYTVIILQSDSVENYLWDQRTNNTACSTDITNTNYNKTIQTI